MASAAKDGPVEAFLDLVRKEKFREAAEEFVKLVKDLRCSKLTLEKEQDFRLHINKAFKRLSKFVQSKEAVRGLLSILERSPPHGAVVMEALSSILTSSLGHQVASCETAASAFWHYGEWLFAPLMSPPYQPRHGQEEYTFKHVSDHLLNLAKLMQDGPPSFVKGALQQRLLQQVIACFPWGQQLSALKYRGQLGPLAWLAHMLALLVGEFLNKGERSEVPLGKLGLQALVPWLVAFFDELRCMAELAAKDGPWGQEGVQHAEVSAQILFHHLHEMTILNEIMRTPQGPSFEAAARKLLSCISSPDAKLQGGALVSNIHYLRVQRGAPTKDTLKDFEGVQGLLQRVQQTSGSARSEALWQLLSAINGGTVPALQNLMLHCEVVSCLTQVFQAELEATLEVETVEINRLASILELLSLFTGLVDMSDSGSLRGRL
ncbi:hypothetical protein KFL_000630200 [Klebsormidium nitens]|uniref:Uncharacterized protein n=1 Tax=Klebsormidium nitens TaxID=105231 RepID=A0A1Y1HWB8_KLENI|nr:hypothetical protein KFL_000630200 [Klebsormidium nitens]|eukprot:GAQ80817.1 hypothetical protein KFL_000630200 [Klebsormidium nitens]